MRDQALQSIAPAEVLNGNPLAKSLLALNNAHAQELSWLELERLQHLVFQAFLARRIGNLDAFLLAFDQGADYDSPNFLWFRALSTLCVCGPDRGRINRVQAGLCAQALSRPVRTCGPSWAWACRLRGQHAAAEPGLGYFPRGLGIRRGRNCQRLR